MRGLAAAWRLLDDGRDRSEFYRMWRAGTAAGFTVPKALDAMGPRDAPQVETLRQWLMAGTRRGDSVTRLVRTGGSPFDEFERAVLVLGDESGRLEESLGELADFHARKHRLMLAVRKQMAYPLFTGVLATLIAPLPLLAFGRTATYGGVVAAGLAGWAFAGGAIVLSLAKWYGRKPAFVRARFARGLTSAIEAGLPLGRSVQLAADASADETLRTIVHEIDERTLSTQSVVSTIGRWPYLTPDLRAVLEVAETTGDFSGVKRLAELYEDGFR